MSRNYGRGDDGTFWMGLFAAGMALVGFAAGYTIRDSGYKFNATQTPTQQEQEQEQEIRK